MTDGKRTDEYAKVGVEATGQKGIITQSDAMRFIFAITESSGDPTPLIAMLELLRTNAREDMMHEALTRLIFAAFNLTAESSEYSDAAEDFAQSAFEKYMSKTLGGGR